MTSIKFLLIGDAGVGKSTVLDVYLWKLHYGYAFHDHRIDQRRYLIDVIEILSFDQLHHHMYQNHQDIIINVLCFNVTDRKTLGTLRREWIPEILKINKNTKMFLMGLQCDLREQFLTKLTQNCFSHDEGIQVCLYYENLHYVECSSLKLACVNAAFETILEIFFYEDVQKQLEEKILKLYAAMKIQFEFYGPIMWKDGTKNAMQSKLLQLKDEMENEMDSNEVISKDETESVEGILNNETESEAVKVKDGTVSEVEKFKDETENDLPKLKDEAESISESAVVNLQDETDSSEQEVTILENEIEYVIESQEQTLRDEMKSEATLLKDEPENDMVTDELVLRDKSNWDASILKEVMESGIVKYETYLDEAIFNDETECEADSDADILENETDDELESDETKVETVTFSNDRETKHSSIVVTTL